MRGGNEMIVGCPRETKNHEYRVGLTPAGANALAAVGHTVLVEHNAGARVGFLDDDYLRAGARIADSPAEVYGRAELVVKVKEIQRAEIALVRPGQILFCFHHFAPDATLLQAMLDSGASCLAFETVADASGGLPLLAPMSRIAGRLAPQVGAWALQMANGGSGVLLGGVPGVPPAKVAVIGAGSVGANAAQIAAGMGADVTVLDRSVDRLAALDALYRGHIRTAAADPMTLAEHVAGADLVVGAVLTAGKLAPKLIGRDLLRRMRPGSVIVDVAIDQGGISAASRPTSHSEPLFAEEGVIHYCVPNMPSAVARTATMALAQATLPYALAIANIGLDEALTRDPGLRRGLQVHRGEERGIIRSL
ncbi:MAG: alanine dehydrogenase [Candidatus Nitricoxidivorans perseverans]|uniref:Alanine dehydrogenase n=1 Tax=Candidatus Nitricoxidivorans perseverans TaxID=2975601 RepID=A0AA49FM15_9PROT|nr:MAG: alanine dehydrogenase [Candidatus Nitricoxidivorans perseverans]